MIHKSEGFEDSRIQGVEWKRQKTEDRGQRSEVRGRKTEIRGQRSEDRSQETGEGWRVGYTYIGLFDRISQHVADQLNLFGFHVGIKRKCYD